MLNAGTTQDSSFTYDVFLSFRGQDTRFGFTKNLHDALVQHKVKAFMDVVNLEKGEEIDDALLGAIDSSKIAIIVFSRNYANSSWCLGELAKIIECKDRRGMKVIPVFYYIEPTIIRKQTDSYGKAMAVHEERFKDGKEKVQRWRTALTRAASISGWDTINVYEVDLIRSIVEDVSKKLKAFSSNESRKTIQATSQGHVVKNGFEREKRVSDMKKSDVNVSFDGSHMAAATAAKASSKSDDKLGSNGKRSVSDEEKGILNTNWKDMAEAVANTVHIREEPPSYSSVMGRYESFENPLAMNGSQSFGSRDDENASSGNPQYATALYDFITGEDDELNLTAGEEIEIEYEVNGWFYVKKKRPGRDGRMSGLVPILYVDHK